MKLLFRVNTRLTIAIMLFAVSCGQEPSSTLSSPWPTWTPSVSDRAAAVTYETEYRKMYQVPDAYMRYVRPFAPFGGYMNASTTGVSFATIGPNLRWDANHVPQITYDGGVTWVYNPVTVAHYALFAHDSCLHGNSIDCTYLVKAAEQLIAMEGPEGGIRYNVSVKPPGASGYYAPGWVSGMAQGQALSVFARAYLLTLETKYLTAGTLAFRFLATPIALGGTTGNLGDLNPALSSYITLEEYPPVGSDKQSYVLNGALYGLLGVYEWWMLDPEANAAAGTYWQSALLTYKRLLRYYDIGGFTTYDLLHLTQGVTPDVTLPYHSDHLALLNAFIWATGDPLFWKYWLLWKNYVDTQTPVRPIRGDVNGDGAVTAIDVRWLKSLLGQPPSNWKLQQLAAGDLDDDGMLTSEDIVLCQQLAKGIPN